MRTRISLITLAFCLIATAVWSLPISTSLVTSIGQMGEQTSIQSWGKGEAGKPDTYSGYDWVYEVDPDGSDVYGFDDVFADTQVSSGMLANIGTSDTSASWSFKPDTQWDYEASGVQGGSGTSAWTTTQYFYFDDNPNDEWDLHNRGGDQYATDLSSTLAQTEGPAPQVPEPATFCLVGLALAALAYRWRRN